MSGGALQDRWTPGKMRLEDRLCREFVMPTIAWYSLITFGR
jgi:hypothetical protein